jgi:hypothetical protein
MPGGLHASADVTNVLAEYIERLQLIERFRRDKEELHNPGGHFVARSHAARRSSVMASRIARDASWSRSAADG